MLSLLAEVRCVCAYVCRIILPYVPCRRERWAGQGACVCMCTIMTTTMQRGLYYYLLLSTHGCTGPWGQPCSQWPCGLPFAKTGVVVPYAQALKQMYVSVEALILLPNDQVVRFIHATHTIVTLCT